MMHSLVMTRVIPLLGRAQEAASFRPHIFMELYHD
jgi:hypothetical protein